VQKKGNEVKKYINTSEQIGNLFFTKAFNEKSFETFSDYIFTKGTGGGIHSCINTVWHFFQVVVVVL